MAGKKYNDASRRYDNEHLHSPSEALDVVRSLASAGFDESVDLIVCLGVDPRKAEEMLRGTVSLPSGSGKDVRVAVFAQGEAATLAREAGAEFVGGDELAAEVEGGMLDFDVAIASPDMMPTVGKLGRVLGPRGLMPNPKTGTVTFDVGKAVSEAKAGKVEYRTDKTANVHVVFGKASFDADKLKGNLVELAREIIRAKPAAAKGIYMKKVSVCTTMGPGIGLDIASLVDETKQ